MFKTNKYPEKKAKSYQNWEMQFAIQIPRVFGIGGREKFHIHRTIQDVKKKILIDVELDIFNFNILSGKFISSENLLSIAMLQPITAAERLIIVNDSEFIRENQCKKITNYIKNPAPNTVIIFVFENIDLQHVLKNFLNMLSVLYIFDYPNLNAAKIFTQTEIKKRNLQISKAGIVHLLSKTGTSLLSITKALDKLELSTNNRTIVASLITTQIYEEKIKKVEFLFALAVFMKKKEATIKFLIKLEKEKISPIKIVPLLAQQLLIILRIKLALKIGWTKQKISKNFKISNENLLTNIKVTKFSTIAAYIIQFRTLLEIEMRLKTTTLSNWTILYDGIRKLTE